MKAKATVSAIIDGTGSIGINSVYCYICKLLVLFITGAAIGPLLAGWLSGMVHNYIIFLCESTYLFIFRAGIMCFIH